LFEESHGIVAWCVSKESGEQPVSCRFGWALVILACLTSGAGATDFAKAACGGPEACVVASGRYRLALPATEPQGALIFFHGYQSSADAFMHNDALIAAANRAGLALVLPDGMGESWSFPHSPSSARDDIAFVGEILDDLDRRFGFGPNKTFVAGFSMGASMAYYAVCAYGARMAGVITIAGVLWEPLPDVETCKGPIPPMVHIHGTNDGTFPLAGRQIGASHHQGDTRKSIALLRTIAHCGPPHPRQIGDLTCEETGCAAGGPVVLCLHGGGHELGISWLEAALRYLRH
jgi:polyhydroxybutyrate depolymerase